MLVLLVVLIFCSVNYSLAENVTVCVKSEGALCQTKNANANISNLSRLPALLEDYSEVETLCIHFTSGNHSILNFTTANVEIQGAEESIIHCNFEAGIKFDHENNRNLVMKDLILNYCNGIYTCCAVSLKNITYTLKNVSVIGCYNNCFYSTDCEKQTIHNCTFDRNGFKVNMTNSTMISVNISETMGY